jgi:hypothetical protein
MTEPQSEDGAHRGAVINISTSATLSGEDRYIHSEIFSKLVANQDDIVGLVAYGIYQVRKREWIEDFRRRHGCLPAEQVVRDHSEGYQNSSLTALRQEAEGRLASFATEIAESQLPELQERAFNSRATQELEKIHGEIKRIGRYRHHIAGHIIGFATLVLIVILISAAVNNEPTIEKYAHVIASFFGLGK